MKADPTTL